MGQAEQVDRVLPARPSTTVSMTVVETGAMHSNALFSYRGASLERRAFAMDCFLLEHPSGTIVCEGGFGRKISEHLSMAPKLLTAFSAIRPSTALVDQLKMQGIAPDSLQGLWLTHAHWDHVGALQDMPGVPIHIDHVEHDFIHSGDRAAALANSFGELNYQPYGYADGPYAGFARSNDVFGDGSVVVVPAGGHTPGSVMIFVRTATRDYLLIGDQAWQREGVAMPQERPWLPAKVLDSRPDVVRSNLVNLHALQTANPELVIVPTHDRSTTKGLPRLMAA